MTVIFPIKTSPWLSFVSLIALTLALTGCASPANKPSQTNDEEAYIDLKHGFSLVVPSAWKRERLPVSSPRHQPDTVEWVVGSTGTQKSVFRVSLFTSPSLRDSLSNIEHDRFKLIEKSSESSEHPAGQALRWESEDQLEKILILSITGSDRTYILTAKATAGSYTQLLPTLEKVISSFSILPN